MSESKLRQKWVYSHDNDACSPADVDVFLLNVNECLSAVADWMDSNRLQLNNKTEFLGVKPVVASIVYQPQVQ